MTKNKDWVIHEPLQIPYGHPKRSFGQKVRKVVNTILFDWAYRCPINSLRIRFHRWRGCHIGEGVYIGRYCFLDNMYPEYIYIYDGASINANTMILTHFNPFETFSKIFSAEVKPTIIGKNAIVAVRCTIMPGVKIGKYAVVSSGCTIEQDVPDYNMVQMANKLRSIDLKAILDTEEKK